jgi:signal peptidase I
MLLIDERTYNRAEPERGDIIVMRYPHGLIVKRIVGLPGEEVEVRRGILYVNGSVVEESHDIEPGNLDVEKGNLSSGDFATLGDNRAVPSALAIHPIAVRADIVGKVVLILGKKWL